MAKLSDKIMANIQNKLTYLSGTKEAIKQAIVAKGVEVTDTDTFRSYADKIEAIQSGGSGTVNIPDGTKFSKSTFTTISDSIIPYLEAQNSMDSMFDSCLNLQTVPQFDTSICTNMNSMFFGCRSLQTVSLLDTRQVNDMSYMFTGCESLQTVPLFDTSKCTYMTEMFSSCISLQTIPQFNTSKVTSMVGMFSSCASLTTLPLLDTSQVEDTDSMFYDCDQLTNLGGFTDLKTDLDLSSGLELTVDSVMNVINNAADMTSSPRTLTLYQDVFNKLTEEQIATASAKGWNIAAV